MKAPLQPAKRLECGGLTPLFKTAPTAGNFLTFQKRFSGEKVGCWRGAARVGKRCQASALQGTAGNPALVECGGQTPLFKVAPLVQPASNHTGRCR